ncbi:MAG TPA: hypothetical protein VGR00_13630, partial [Thermoanaerobaculia bacterium]|nr:hypothetical protein [Thermoanaerobaculia bacterium]
MRPPLLVAALLASVISTGAVAEIPIHHDATLKTRSRKERIAKFLLPAMRQAGLRAWLVVTREGTIDPLAFDVGLENAVARAAALFVDDGKELKAVAVVASYDVDGPRSSGLYAEVTPYGKEGLGPTLEKLLSKHTMSGKIGLDISYDTPIADGLTAGTRDWLVTTLGPEFAARFTSAEAAILSFRAK